MIDINYIHYSMAWQEVLHSVLSRHIKRGNCILITSLYLAPKTGKRFSYDDSCALVKTSLISTVASHQAMGCLIRSSGKPQSMFSRTKSSLLL